MNTLEQISKPKRIRPKLDIITLTESAANRVKELINIRNKPTAGIRIKITTKGCSGLSYALEYVDEIEKLDEVVETGDVKVYIDPKAILFLIGSEMDYEEGKMQSGFIFKNPNEKSKCGCGESFNV